MAILQEGVETDEPTVYWKSNHQNFPHKKYTHPHQREGCKKLPISDIFPRLWNTFKKEYQTFQRSKHSLFVQGYISNLHLLLGSVLFTRSFTVIFWHPYLGIFGWKMALFSLVSKAKKQNYFIHSGCNKAFYRSLSPSGGQIRLYRQLNFSTEGQGVSEKWWTFLWNTLLL